MGDRQYFFNLNDASVGISRELAPGISTRVFVGEQAMLSVVELAPRATGEMHRHPQEQWGVLLRGDGYRHQDGEKHRVTAGDFWRTPGGMKHGFSAGENGATILDIFSPPRDEYKAPGSGFGNTVQE